MSLAARILLGALAALALFYIYCWFSIERARACVGETRVLGLTHPAVGFVTNFFDTLGVGSFAPTTSIFKLLKLVPDEKIPGTLNAGHALPTVVQALIFIAVVSVDPTTMVSMIAAAVLGAWLGAGVVARLPRVAIQVGMGVALLAAAILFVLGNLEKIPTGGDALALRGSLLAIAIGVNFMLGALMTLGVGLYAPCLILVSLLGLNPIAAFPIMMGSCAFLMPISSIRFVKTRSYHVQAALGLALGGLPAALIAALIVKSLPLGAVRWLVVFVVIYTAINMLITAKAGAAELHDGRIAEVNA